MEKKHWALIAAVCGCASVQLAGVKNWSDTVTTLFVAGLLGQIGITIGALFVGAPGASAALEQANKNTELANESTKAALTVPMDRSKVDPKRYLGVDTDID